MVTPDFTAFEKLARQGNLIPIYREVLADLESPVSILMKLRSRPYAFLLESMEGGEKWGRYTFLGADPAVVFKVLGEDCLILKNGDQKKIKHQGNPLKILKELLDRYRPVSVGGLPRFYGGAVGFLGYEMVRYFEKLPAHPPEDCPEEAVFMITDTMIIFDNLRHTLKIAACLHIQDGDDLSLIYQEGIQKINALLELLKTPLVKEPSESSQKSILSLKPNLTPAAFREMVKKAKSYIVNGDILQVVLSQRFEGENDHDPIAFYRALRYINPSPYLFFLKLEDLFLVGSSPEILVRLEEGRVEVRPIAGTRRRGKDEEEEKRLLQELLEDPKERAEHIMLVDLGRNDLGRIAAVGTVQVPELMIVERYSHVMHLVSHVQAELAPGQDCFNVFRATFPAGTLTGAPKIRAMEIIHELEPSARGSYGGAVGYFSFSGNLDFCITIRTIVLKGRKIFVQAGAGIVADSDPEFEYQESLNKAKGMLKAIQLAERGLEL
ncbi:MAG: anthranilate synthase component I [Pseudomonadota bacterium]